MFVVNIESSIALPQKIDGALNWSDYHCALSISRLVWGRRERVRLLQKFERALTTQIRFSVALSVSLLFFCFTTHSFFEFTFENNLRVLFQFLLLACGTGKSEIWYFAGLKSEIFGLNLWKVLDVRLCSDAMLAADGAGKGYCKYNLRIVVPTRPNMFGNLHMSNFHSFASVEFWKTFCLTCYYVIVYFSLGVYALVLRAHIFSSCFSPWK